MSLTARPGQRCGERTQLWQCPGHCLNIYHSAQIRKIFTSLCCWGVVSVSYILTSLWRIAIINLRHKCAIIQGSRCHQRMLVTVTVTRRMMMSMTSWRRDNGRHDGEERRSIWTCEHIKIPAIIRPSCAQSLITFRVSVCISTSDSHIFLKTIYFLPNSETEDRRIHSGDCWWLHVLDLSG